MYGDHTATVKSRLSWDFMAYYRLRITEGVITGVLKIEGRIIVIWLNYGNPFRTFWWRIARVTDNRLLTVPLCSIHKKSWWLFFYPILHPSRKCLAESRLKNYAIGVLRQDPETTAYNMTSTEICAREEDGIWYKWKMFPCKRMGRYALVLLYCCGYINFMELEVYGTLA